MKISRTLHSYLLPRGAGVAAPVAASVRGSGFGILKRKEGNHKDCPYIGRRIKNGRYGRDHIDYTATLRSVS